MTYEQGVRIASRTLAAYLLLWALTDLIEIPREIFSGMSAYRAMAGLSDTSPAIFASEHRSFNSSVQFLAENLLRVPLWLALALWFYRCGPVIQRYFGLNVSAE